MPALDELIRRVRSDVDITLDKLVPKSAVEPKHLHEAIRWSLFAGGKRIRPVIVHAAGETFGADKSLLATPAAAIEMVHTYSLIHDDLPSMDDDDLRRGRATCHKQFGEATAILAGDVLQSLAFKAIAAEEQLSHEVRITLIAILADASATPSGMVAGQQLDLQAEGRSLSVSEIETIHSLKTGALIKASAAIGAVIGGASAVELEAVGRYAERLGLLFQITDDLLDVTQQTATLGKTAGKDAAAAKATYPAHYGLEGAATIAKTVCDDALTALSTLRQDTSLLADLARNILDRST